jgi:hypothetical protein
MKKLRIVLTIISLTLIATSVNAIDLLERNSGTWFMGMGGAGGALASDVNSASINPAGLAYVQKTEISSTYVSRFDSESATNTIGFAYPILGGVLGLNIVQESIGGLIAASEDPNTGLPVTGDTFSDTKRVINIAFARKLGSLHLGTNIKLLTEDLYNEKANGYGVDIGILYGSSPLSLGLTLRNVIRPQMNWSTGSKNEIPSKATLGTAFKTSLFDKSLSIAADVDIQENKNSKLFSGGEYWLLQDLFALRIGLDQGKITWGLGFRYGGMKVDYAYKENEDLGESHRVTIGFSFENKEVKYAAR